MRILILVFLQLLCGTAAFTAGPRNNSPYYVDPNTTAIQEIRGTVESVRHEVRNHEVEIRTFDEKLQNLDSIIESVRDQLADNNKSQKELLKGSSNSLESKITSLEILSKNLVSDVKQFKTHATEMSTILTQYKQKIAELEKIVEQQSQSMDHLQMAMRTLTEAFQVKETPPPSKVNTSSGPTYRIQSGDTLEKIARTNQTTVQALRDLNNLTNDRIVVGKVLQLPEN